MHTDIGLWLLVAFLIPVSFTMHAFWKMQDPMVKMREMMNFTKNISLLGAVLVMMSSVAFVDNSLPHMNGIQHGRTF